MTKYFKAHDFGQNYLPLRCFQQQNPMITTITMAAIAPPTAPPIVAADICGFGPASVGTVGGGLVGAMSSHMIRHVIDNGLEPIRNKIRHYKPLVDLPQYILNAVGGRVVLHITITMIKVILTQDHNERHQCTLKITDTYG